MSGEWIRDLPMAAYLADRDHLSGHVLSMVDAEPEEYGRWVKGQPLLERRTEALDRGSLFTARATGDQASIDDVAYLPTRAEFCEPAWELTNSGNPRKLKGKKVPRLGEDGRQLMTPQDASPAGEHKSMLANSEFAKAAKADFLRNNRGRIIATPETQAMVNAMLHALHRHPEASALLHPEGLEPELTGRWASGADRFQIRPDAARLADGVLIEIKTVAPKHGRLNTLRPRSVLAWAQDGWARKSAMLHAGFGEIERRNADVYWIIVEATERDPRVSVIPDPCDSLMSAIGREGSVVYDVRGYRELAVVARHLSRTGDFRARCTRPPDQGGPKGWVFPDFVERSMRDENKVPAGPTLTGARS